MNDGEGSSSNYRTYVGRVGALAVALGIGTMIATGPSMPTAHADNDGSSSSHSSTRPAKHNAERSSTTSRAQANGKAPKTAAAPARVSPAATVDSDPLPDTTSRRSDAQPPKTASPAARAASPDIVPESPSTLATPTTHSPTATPPIDVAPTQAPVTPTAKATTASTINVPLASPVVAQTLTYADPPVAPQPAAAASAVVKPAATSIDVSSPSPPPPAQSPAPAVKVFSPPIATVSVATTVSNLLASLSRALTGGVPAVPADAGLALMLGAARREIGAAQTPQAAAAKRPAATATSSTTTPGVEAEKMAVSGAVRTVFDRRASGRYALAISGSGQASTTITLPEMSALTLRLRSAAGAPDMTLSIDGVPYTTLLVNNTSYSDYTFAGGISAGTHVISVSSTTATSRNTLYVDKLTTSTGPIVDEFLGKSGSSPQSHVDPEKRHRFRYR